jgi:hypothetical protein
VWERDKSSFSDHIKNDSCVSTVAIPTSGCFSKEKKSFWTPFFFSRFYDFFYKFAFSLGDLWQAQNYSLIWGPVTDDRQIELNSTVDSINNKCILNINPNSLLKREPHIQFRHIASRSTPKVEPIDPST